MAAPAARAARFHASGRTPVPWSAALARAIRRSGWRPHRWCPLDAAAACARRRSGRAVVHVVQPREVVQVAALAGEHEPGGHRGRPAVAVAAAAVHVADPLRPPRVGQQRRTARSRPGPAGCSGYRSSAASAETAAPAHRPLPTRRTGRGSPACTAACAASRPAGRAAPAPRRAAAAPSRSCDVAQIPVVQPGDDHGQVRQVGDGTDAVGVQ